MNIQNKLLLLAIASVISTSVMPNIWSFGSDMPVTMNGNGRGVAQTPEPRMGYGKFTGTAVAEPLENKIAAEQASNDAIAGAEIAVAEPLENKIAAEQASNDAMVENIKTTKNNLVAAEKTPGFTNQPGRVVSATRKLRATYEAALSNAKTHQTRLARSKDRISTLSADLDNTLNARAKQVKEDMDAIANKQTALEDAMTAPTNTSVAARYTAKGELVGGSAGLLN